MFPLSFIEKRVRLIRSPKPLFQKGSGGLRFGFIKTGMCEHHGSHSAKTRCLYANYKTSNELNGRRRSDIMALRQMI
jgi:hypothetical protein